MKNTPWHKAKWVTGFSIVLLLYTVPAAGSSLLWSYSINGITSLSVSGSGNFLAVGCQDGYYYIFDTWGNLTGSGNVPSAVNSLDITDTGDVLIGSAAGYTFSTKDGAQGSTYLSPPVNTVSISTDGTFSLVCSERNLYINLETSMVQQLEVGSNSPFGIISADGSTACAAVDTSLHIFRDGEFQEPYTLKSEVEHLFVSADGNKILFSTNEDLGYIDIENGELHTENRGSPIQKMAVNSSGDSVLIITDHVLWLDDGTNELEIDGRSIQHCALAGDGSLAVLGRGSILQIMTKGGTAVLTRDFDTPLEALTVSREGNLLAVCTENGVYAFQLFQKAKHNTHVIPTASKKSLPITSPLEEVWSIPVDKNASFFVADVDGDGTTEIALKEGTTMKLIDEEGTLESIKELEILFSRFIPLDSDGDTLPEIFIEFEPSFEFSAYDWREETIKDYYYNTFRDMTAQGTVIPFAALDSDNDGEREILASVSTGYACSPRGIVSIDSETGALEWFYQVGPGAWPSIVEDIDGDGTIDIVLGSLAPCNCPDAEEYPDCETSVYAISSMGEELWKVHMGEGYLRAKVCAADIHPQEGMEIIGFGYEASWNWGRLFVLSCYGEYLYDLNPEYSVFFGAVGDIDGDESKEIVALDSRGYLTVFTPDLQEKSKILVGNSINQNSQVYLNDINGDGHCEILLAVEKELFILDENLSIVWEKKFEDEIKVLLTYFSGCKNTLLVLSDRLYAYSYKDGKEPCPLWEITERELLKEGTTHLETAESSFAEGEYRVSLEYFEKASTIFSQLEDQDMIDSTSHKITEVSTIIFKENVKIGIIILAVCAGFLCVMMLYSRITRKRWSRLVEGAVLFSLPVLLGLFQVYFAADQYLWVFVRYFVPSVILSAAVFVRQDILGFARTILAWRGGHKDLLVLSIGRSDGSYRVSVESIEEKFRPVKESREIAFSKETRDDLIKKVEYMMECLRKVPSETYTLSYAEELLKETGAVIYQKVIPENFSDILKAKFLLLEVEDTEIPWELMYSDDFYSLKYAISRRIVTTESVTVREKKISGRRALIISDPRENLPNAKKECGIVYKRLTQKMETTLVEGHDATVGKVANLFGQGFDIIHYAGHVDNGLVLSDGVMTPEEVREYIVGTPVVVVNGCKSEELARAFLLGGAMAYVGTIHPVHDRSAADIVADFYDLCLQYQIGEALRRAREYHMNKHLVWASLVMYGDPTLKLL